MAITHPFVSQLKKKKKEIDIHKAIGNMKHLNWRADFWGEKRVKTQPVKDTNNNLRLTSAGEMLGYLRANSMCTEFQKGYWLKIALKTETGLQYKSFLYKITCSKCIWKKGTVLRSSLFSISMFFSLKWVAKNSQSQRRL